MEVHKNIRIGYFADGPWSHHALEVMLKDTDLKIVFVVPRTGTKDFILKAFSEKYNIDYIPDVKVNSAEFIEKVQSYQCDLLISMSFNQIFKSEILNLPPLKTINCHAGKLPFYRGRNVLNWVLINDEKEFGITVHYVDEGVDTGDIILQRTFSIGDQDTYKSLLERAFIECGNLLYDAIKLIKANRVIGKKQKDIHPIGFCCGIRGVGDEVINWNQSSREIFNFIRAICEPGPAATTFLNGIEVKVNSSKLILESPSYINTPGQIVGKTQSGFLVKTRDSTIEILEVSSSSRIRIGDKFQSR